MEKITKEELKNMLTGIELSDEDLEKIAGGKTVDASCVNDCMRSTGDFFICSQVCTR